MEYIYISFKFNDSMIHINDRLLHKLKRLKPTLVKHRNET